jgi:hypothetical protein
MIYNQYPGLSRFTGVLDASIDGMQFNTADSDALESLDSLDKPTPVNRDLGLSGNHSSLFKNSDSSNIRGGLEVPATISEVVVIPDSSD